MSLNPKHIHFAKLGFQNKCLFVLVEGYNLMKANGNYQSDWEEEDLTEQLIYYMEESPYSSKWELDIIPEYRLYSKKSSLKNKTAKKTPRIDIRFSKWQNQKKFEYFIEAKNLCETDCTKNDGATVKSSYQLNRYVNKGIKHFISGYYPINGCLCGYILQGNTKNIIQKINEILDKKSLNNLILDNSINNHSLIYNYKIDKEILVNLFFELIK